jgi:Holliday junction resolvasome RuvABC ATP-dependent DNA helicase subunit
MILQRPNIRELESFVQAANQRNEALDHTLFMVRLVWVKLLWQIF